MANPIKKILILAANPINTTWKRLAKEVSEIEEGIKRSKFREQFRVISKWAVTTRDIQRALLDENPDVVHFCGHGEKEGLLVEDQQGNAFCLDPNALAELFKFFSAEIRCVLLNACYSEVQAAAIRKHIKWVYGMNGPIRQKDALEFAAAFYDALGAGKTYEQAYKFGLSAFHFAQKSRVHNSIFLCHSHKDNILFAEPLAKDLEKHGLKVFYSTWSISAGDSMLEKISRGIRESDCIIVLLTPNSVESHWVQTELELAFDRCTKEGIRIIPVVCKDCQVPDFLAPYKYVDFRKSYTSGLKELLLTFGIQSRIFSESEKVKTILKMFTPEQQAFITEYAIYNDNNEKQAFKEILRKNWQYLVLGMLLTGYAVFGNLYRLLAPFGELIRVLGPFALVIVGLRLAARYLGPTYYVKKYFKIRTRFEDLSTDIEPDIHLDNTGKLFNEFLGAKDKEFYSTYRIEDNDIKESLKICKRKYAKWGVLDLIVLTGLLIYSESLTREPDILIFFKAMTLLAGGYLYTEYNKTIAKINEMYKSMRDFERTRKVFTGQDKQKKRRSN
jgi:hypothetical protein